MQKMGRAVFSAPFRKADAEVASKYRNAGGKAHAFTDQLWNDANPEVGGFSKTNPEIGEEITKLKNQTGADIGNRIAEAGGGTAIDLAPTLRENAQQAQLKDARNMGFSDDFINSQQLGVDPPLSKAQKTALSVLPPEWQEKMKTKFLNENETKPVDDELKDAPDAIQWLKDQLSSPEKRNRENAISILKASAPSLSDVIQKNAKHLNQSAD